MNKQTKILVINQKKLIIGIILVIISLIIVLALILLTGNKKESSPKKATLVNASVSEVNPIDSDASPAKFTPGVYTSSLILNGAPVDISVTVDANNINSIDITNLPDSVSAMYPMLTSSFDDIAKKVIEAGSANIPYDSTNRYTYSLILNAISNALDKAKP